MSKFMKLPRFLLKIENFSSVFKKVFPVILIGGLKYQLTFSHYTEDSVDKIRLMLECLSVFETLPTWQFRFDVYYFLNDNYSYLSKGTTISSLKQKEWCIWSASVTDFYKSYGKVANINLMVAVSPVFSNLENFFKNEEKARDVDGLCANLDGVKILTEDFEKLFNNDEHSDFVLECGEKTFRVHKNVLSVRSDFFAAMFRCDMKEANEGTAKIEDLEPEILELVLRYMYTGKIPELSAESLKKVYAAAERFVIEPLKTKCFSMILDNFSIVPEIGSNKETEKELAIVKEETEHKNKEDEILKELFLTREWRLLSQEFPHTAIEMCKQYFLQK